MLSMQSIGLVAVNVLITLLTMAAIGVIFGKNSLTWWRRTSTRLAPYASYKRTRPCASRIAAAVQSSALVGDPSGFLRKRVPVDER